MTQKISQYALYGAIIAIVLAIVYLFGAEATRVGASVNETSEYQATSTAQSVMYGATASTSRAIKVGPGAFGSYIITGATTGAISFYDATTSNVLARTGQRATSTILLASFPPNTAAGTYTFDIALTQGLYMDLTQGTMATGTVTYR